MFQLRQPGSGRAKAADATQDAVLNNGPAPETRSQQLPVPNYPVLQVDLFERVGIIRQFRFGRPENLVAIQSQRCRANDFGPGSGWSRRCLCFRVVENRLAIEVSVQYKESISFGSETQPQVPMAGANFVCSLAWRMEPKGGGTSSRKVANARVFVIRSLFNDPLLTFGFRLLFGGDKDG